MIGNPQLRVQSSEVAMAIVGSELWQIGDRRKMAYALRVVASDVIRVGVIVENRYIVGIITHACANVMPMLKNRNIKNSWAQKIMYRSSDKNMSETIFVYEV